MSRYIAPLVMGILGTAILVALGLWQVERLQWKQAILAEIDARIAQAPVDLPTDPDPFRDRFLPVRVSGDLEPARILVFSTFGSQGVRLRMIQPLVLPDGRRILLEAGSIAPDLAEDLRLSGPVAATGMLYWPQETDVFTPDPDPATGMWFARDVPALAARLGTLPVLVVASDVMPPDPLLLSLPIDPSGIPNNHLEYAVTWFGLALVWVGMTILWLRRTAQRRGLDRLKR